jgi:predicted transcriptional regulator
MEEEAVSKTTGYLEILQKLFDLTGKQQQLLEILIQHGSDGICIYHLVNLMQSERSLVQKQLTALLKKNLIERRRVTLNQFNDRCLTRDSPENQRPSDKGYLYLYFVRTPEELFRMAIEKLQEWEAKLNQFRR